MEVISKLQDEETLSVLGAVVLYGKGMTVLARIHPILTDREQELVLGPGRQMTFGDIEGLAASLLKGGVRVRDVFDERVLYVDAGLMAWYSLAFPREIYFDTQDANLKALSGSRVWHPPLVFVVTRGVLQAYALDSYDERPTGDTPLFRAPYPNLYQNGAMCSGNVNTPKGVSLADIDAWERAFYDSAFTHTNTTKVTSHPEGLAGLWGEVKRVHDWQVHTGYFVSAKRTLREVLNG